MDDEPTTPDMVLRDPLLSDALRDAWDQPPGICCDGRRLRLPSSRRSGEATGSIDLISHF